MIKYIPKYTKVVFNEIPDEVTLAVNITNCQNHCIGCHTPELAENIGEELTDDIIDKMLDDNYGISCVCLMGEGNDQNALLDLVRHIKTKYPDVLTAIYSGREDVEDEFNELFDYIKIGPYKKECGPLNVRTTNQRLYAVKDRTRVDITYKFWEK